MKIIEPEIELLQQGNNIVSHVAKCARVCYGKTDGDDQRTYDTLIIRKHLSMLRHATRYFIIPEKHADDYIKSLAYINETNIIAGIDLKRNSDGAIYIAANGQWCFEHPDIIKNIEKHEINVFGLGNGFDKELIRYTFKVTTQISTSRELNRVSPNNIAERSTRYVYEDGSVCRPHWMTKEEAEYINTEPILNDDWIENHSWAKRYIWTVDNSFYWYKDIIAKGMHRQDARGMLPIDTATICVYTYTLKEWKHILDLRYYGTTGKPHPNAKLIANLIRIKLNELGYEFTD